MIVWPATQNRRPENRSDRFTLVVPAIPPLAVPFWTACITPRQWREVRPESLDLLETSLELLENRQTRSAWELTGRSGVYDLLGKLLTCHGTTIRQCSSRVPRHLLRAVLRNIVEFFSA